MNNVEYKKVGVFGGVAVSIGSLSDKKPIVMQEITEHQFEVGNKTVKVPLHWFYPKMLKNAQKGKRPVFVKMHFYSKYLRTIFETGKPEREVIVRVKVSRKYRDKKLTDIILDVYPERHNAETKYDLVFTMASEKAIAVPNALEKICFMPRDKK